MSTVNAVATKRSLVGAEVVVKTFAETAKVTGVALPLQRVQVELAANAAFRWASSQYAPSIQVPQITHVAPSCLAIEMPRIGDRNVRESNADIWPPKERWRELGWMLGRIERELSTAEAAGWFGSALPVTEHIQRILLDYKFPELDAQIREQAFRANNVLCHGDLSLANLVICPLRRLGLVDFEFSHIGPAGFDAGQVVAELKSVEGIRAEGLADVVLEGFELAGGSMSEVRMWSSAFASYYWNKSANRSSAADTAMFGLTIYD